eukprot:Lankesteria_metandrocarpae@DN4218_c0_g1_i2.p1
MFKCRTCSWSPFGALFGYGDYPTMQSRSGNGSRSSTVTHAYDFVDGDGDDSFIQRSPGEVVSQCNQWLDIVHYRARALWSEDEIRDVLSQLASGVSKRDDPLSEAAENEEDYCAIWTGDYSKQKLPILQVKTAQSNYSTLVTRALVFMFADDSSYTELQACEPNPGSPAKPFEMACNKNSCVKVGHIALPDLPE